MSIFNFQSLNQYLVKKLIRLHDIAGLDFHILATLIFRVWGVLGGVATIFLLPFWLSPVEQGYYFTFSSVLALQVFFELGFNQVVMQLVSHETANLSETTSGRLHGKEIHLSRLTSLSRLIRSWYAISALLFALIGGILGAIFFSQKGAQPMSHWLGTWVALVGGTAVNLWLSPRLAMMEGFGKVGQVARLRLAQSVLGFGVLWAMLISGMGLWSVTAVPIVSAICTWYWVQVRGNILHSFSSRAVDAQSQIRWRSDVFPLQWRIALSWMSGYLIFSLFTPMVFSRQGAVEAGRLGMALTVFSAISTVGMSWVNAKAPNFTKQIALGERRELNRLFKAVFLRSTFFIILASTVLVIVIWYLKEVEFMQVSRIASPSVLTVLAITTVVNSMVFAMAIYMRAHREEPMLVPSLVTGLLVATTVYIGSIYGTFIMMFLYMLVSVLISLPWTYILFIKYFNRASV
jgi:hypothetical protein